MKVKVYMAPTANGMIAKSNGDESFVSEENEQLWIDTVRKTGNVVVGRKAFEVARAEGIFPTGGALNVVLTKRKVKNRWGDRAMFTNRSPKEVVDLLKSMGFKTAMVAGGGRVNASFIKSGLVDEICLSVQPKIFGKGINLFEGKEFDVDLRLLRIKRLSKNEVMLIYKVLNKRRV